VILLIRDYAPDDLQSVIELWQNCNLTRPWNDPEHDIARAIANPSSTILVGLIGDALVASCMVGHDGHRGWLYYVAVESNHQNRGLGKQIVAAAENWLRNHGAIKVMLMVRSANTSVIDFYTSANYAKSEVQTLEKWLTPDGKRPT
jgi:ribosomal protein S18 acetylase RimI-like enzyme